MFDSKNKHKRNRYMKQILFDLYLLMRKKSKSQLFNYTCMAFLNQKSNTLTEFSNLLFGCII